MSTREFLSRRCILLKRVPDDIDEKCICRRISGVEKSHRYNEFSLEPCEVRWVVLLENIESAEKLIRDCQVPVFSLDGTECNLRVGPCPECIIPDDWLETLTPDGTSINFFDDQMLDSIGMKSIRQREQENNAPKTDVSDKVEEEEENQDTYVPNFVIPAISSPYSGPNYMADSNDSRPYSSIKSQLSEDKDEANDDSNPDVTKSENLDSDPEKVPMMGYVSSRKNGDEEDPYATIDDVNLKSFIENHDTPPSLPERPGKTESKDEFSLTYLEPFSMSKNSAQQTENASDEYQSNDAWNGDDHPDKLQSAKPQILSNPNADVNASTYTEPLKRNSSANESDKQAPSLPTKPHKENHCIPYESLGFNVKVSTSSEENSNTGCQTTVNTAKLYPDLGEDFNKIPQTSVNQAYRSQGAIPKVTRGNTGLGSVGKDVDALYQNHQMIKRPDPSPSVPETGQNGPDRMPVGFSVATPLPGNFVDQTEAKSMEMPQNGLLPPLHPNFMMALQGAHGFLGNPQNQQNVIPNFMDPRHQQQPNIPGIPGTPYPAFPNMPFFPFPQLPNQGNNIPQTGGERIPMPEPQFPVVPQGVEGEIPVAKKEEVESETNKTNQSASPQGRKKKQSVTPKQEDHIDDKPTGSEGMFDTIRVRLKQPLTQDTLENYFENKRKSGGGDIDSLTIIKGTEMEVEEVLITFSESKDAMNCLQQQHIIDKKTLNVQKYDPNDPSLWEMDKALVTGMNPVTTEDTLMNFLESAAGVEPLDLVRGAQEDAAIVVFAEKPDFAKMSKRCKEKKLEGNTLFVQMVEKCQTIYVKGVDKSITYDLVENFFCNKRKSGGGDVEKVDYHPEDGYCIVYFENPSDAKNAAAKEKFTINDREIQVQMYFPCLGLPEQPINWEDMPCVSYEGNEYIVKFVKSCPKECSQIEEALQKKFVKVEWPKLKSDFTVKLQCTVTKDVENAKEILKSWKEEAEAEMDRHMKKYVCQKHSTVPEAWPAFLAQLKRLNINQPDRVAVLLEKNNHTVIVAGYEENSEALTRIILDLIKTEESKIQNQTEKIMKNVPLDIDKSTESEGTFDIIRVRLNKPLTQDTLKNYFENKRKSGGGYIESLTIIKGTEMEVEEALITFAESKYAINCPQHHTLYKMSLDVQKFDRHDPSLWEMDKALVTGINPVTTKYTLMNFLEPAAGVELIDVVRGVQEDAAIVIFAGKPDFAKMCKLCNEKTLQGKPLYVQMLKKCQTISVKGIDQSITYDTVKDYFCNMKKSKVGDVEKVDYFPDDGYCIVYFDNPSDARNVAAQGKFTINERDVQAEMFYPSLGLSKKPINWEDMSCVSYESNVYVIMFVRNCMAACSQINKALRKKFVTIKWPQSKSDFIVKLQCTITKDVENAKEILRNWKEEAEAEMDRHMKKIVYQMHSILPEAWSLFRVRLKTVNIDDPDKVTIVLERKNYTAIVTGYEENSEALTRTLLDLIKTEESKIQNQTQRIMKNIPLDFQKCQQLWKTCFGKKMVNNFPELNFQVEINKKEVNLTGKPTEVNEALIMMHEYLMKTKSKSLSISKGSYEILKKKEVKKRLIAEMKAKSNNAVWIVTEDKVEMTSSSSKIVDDALKIFKTFILEKRIKIEEVLKVLTMPDWQSCVKELEENYDREFFISYSMSEVCVTATIYIFENVYQQIESVLKTCFDKCRIDRKVVHLSQQQFRYIKYFGQSEISQITNACISKQLKIKQNQSNCSIEITGNTEDVKFAYHKLMRFIKQLFEDSCSITRLEANMFLNSGIGREGMKTAEKEASSINFDKEELRHIREIKEVGSFKGHRRSLHCLPIKIAECELQFCDKRFKVMKGDVTKLKVDVIVNAANEDLDHCGGLALAISKAGGKSIQEDSRIYIQFFGTVTHGEAVPAKPGELPCKMLIHAVGPRWRGGSHNEEHLLKKTIFRCLELTEKHNYSSIAIPALSAGFYGYPAVESVEAVLGAIELYIKTVPSSIKEIYFCDVNDTIVKKFVKCLKKNFGLEVKEFKGDELVRQSPVQDTDSDSEEENPRRSRPRSEKFNCEVKVISGELAKMRVDVIVNSSDKSLNLTLGATSKSLLRVGGESLQEECRMKYKHGVKAGEVAMTKGGNLHCRQVYHGAIKKWDHYKGDALSKFTEFVDNCLQMADENWMSSIAFPALGTGRLGYPPALAAKTMFKCFRDFLHQNISTTLKEITIVVYYEDKETFQIFRSILSSEDMNRGIETCS